MDLNKVKVTATRITDWSLAKQMALRTEGLKMVNAPDDAWKLKMAVCEHSPLRMVQFELYIENVPQWVTVHYVRHFLGVEKFVHTQRTDRNSSIKVERDDLPQGALNDMSLVLNAQALINISKVRLCNKASYETREVWKKIVEAIREVDPIVAAMMVPSCVYRGFCPEQKPCGFDETLAFSAIRYDYVDMCRHKTLKNK